MEHPTNAVQNHNYRIKYYVLRNNVVEKVLKISRGGVRAGLFVPPCVSFAPVLA